MSEEDTVIRPEADSVWNRSLPEDEKVEGDDESQDFRS